MWDSSKRIYNYDQFEVVTIVKLSETPIEFSDIKTSNPNIKVKIFFIFFCVCFCFSQEQGPFDKFSHKLF